VLRGAMARDWHPGAPSISYDGEEASPRFRVLTANCVCQAVCRVWAGSVILDGLWLPTIGKEHSG